MIPMKTLRLLSISVLVIVAISLLALTVINPPVIITCGPSGPATGPSPVFCHRNLDWEFIFLIDGSAILVIISALFIYRGNHDRNASNHPKVNKVAEHPST